MPEKPGPKGGPQDREKAISVAYLRLTGSSQEDAGSAVGVHRDTVGRWEGSDWWPEIITIASRRWLSGLEAKARQVLLKGMDAGIALKVLERRLPDLAPPTTNLNLRTPDIPDRVEIVLVDPPAHDDETD
jgi:hypothetical protein